MFGKDFEVSVRDLIGSEEGLTFLAVKTYLYEEQGQLKLKAKIVGDEVVSEKELREMMYEDGFKIKSLNKQPFDMIVIPVISAKSMVTKKVEHLIVWSVKTNDWPTAINNFYSGSMKRAIELKIDTYEEFAVYFRLINSSSSYARRWIKYLFEADTSFMDYREELEYIVREVISGMDQQDANYEYKNISHSLIEMNLKVKPITAFTLTAIKRGKIPILGDILYSTSYRYDNGILKINKGTKIIPKGIYKLPDKRIQYLTKYYLVLHDILNNAFYLIPEKNLFKEDKNTKKRIANIRELYRPVTGSKDYEKFDKILKMSNL